MSGTRHRLSSHEYLWESAPPEHFLSRITRPHNGLKAALRQRPQRELAQSLKAKLIHSKIIHWPSCNLCFPRPISRLNDSVELMIAKPHSCGIKELVIALEIGRNHCLRSRNGSGVGVRTPPIIGRRGPLLLLWTIDVNWNSTWHDARTTFKPLQHS